MNRYLPRRRALSGARPALGQPRRTPSRAAWVVAALALLVTAAAAAGPAETPAPGAPSAAASPAPASPTAAPARPARTFGPIEVDGNQRTATKLILRELGFREGDPYDAKLVQKAWDRLEDIGYFAFVDIADEEDDEGRVSLAITVEEDKTLHYYPLICYSRRHDYLLGARVREGNLRGRGEIVDLQATWLRVHGYRLSWTRPWLFNRREFELGVGGGWERAEFVHRDFDYSAWDAGSRLRWYWRAPFYLEAEGTFAGFQQRQDFDEPNPYQYLGYPEYAGDVLRHYAGWRNRFALTLTAGVDTRDLEYYPTRGVYHRLIGRRVISDGFDSYTEAIADLRQFVPMPLHKVLALHAYGRRVSDPHLPVEDRLWWGGPETIRGYRYAGLEGEEGWLLSAEYRWPLFLMPISPDGRVVGIGVHLFGDAGDNWYYGENGHERIALSWGGGAHISVSTQHFRFEFARTREGEDVFQFADRFNF